MTESSPFYTEQVFNSHEELTDWAQNIARTLGFVIVKRRSKEKRGYMFKIELMCSKGNKYKPRRSESSIQRETGTAKTDCPFGLVAKYYKTHDIWRLKVQSDMHNHPYASTLESYPYAMRLDGDEFKLVEELSKYNVQPRYILSTIKERNPNNVSSIRNVYNAQDKIRAVIKGDRTQIQLLLTHLTRTGYAYYERVNDLTNELEELFFVHPKSYVMWCTFPQVMVMDSTYNTTCFKLPFFEIVGFTSTNKTFSMRFSFLDKEQGPNFRWVLQCVKKVIDKVHYPRVIVTDRDLALIRACDVEFPNAKKLLCRWHISNNMLKNCRNRFKTVKEWDSVKYTWEHMIKAPTQAGFNQYYEHLGELLVGHQEVSEYLSDWLENYRDKFVSLLTDQYLSYGESTTCRVESQHALLKKYLGTAQSNLDTLLSSIDKIIIGQQTAIKEYFNRSTNVRKHKFNIPQFEQLWGQVSHHALDYLLEELGRPNSEECGHQLRTSYGLPCAHELLYYDCHGVSIPLESVDIFWRTLDVPWHVTPEDDDLNCQDGVRNFQSAISKMTTFVKKNWLTKLKGIHEPESVSYREPAVHKNTRGRPSAKDKKKQTNQFLPPNADPRRQQTSQFVPPVVDPSRRSYSKPTKIPDLNQEPARHSSYVRQQTESDDLIDYIPEVFRQHISRIKNVAGDGNCGFRSVAVGINLTENMWPEIRQNLLQALHRDEVFYRQMWLDEGFEHIRYTLDHFGSGIVPQDKWMSMPDTGLVIASFYNQPVMFISPGQSNTCFPLWHGPDQSQPIRPIVIGHVGGCHFINLTLYENSPIPTNHPQWRWYASENAFEWEELYSNRHRIC